MHGATSSGGAGATAQCSVSASTASSRVVHAFANSGDGAQPIGNLVQDAAGNIHDGTAYGRVFKIVP